MANARSGKIFYGWWVVAGGFIMMATCYTIFLNCMSLFQPLIVSDLGITLGQYNMASSCSTLVSIVGALFVGSLVDRFSGRVLGAVSVILCSAVLVGFSYLSGLWQLFVLFAIAGLVVVAGTRLLISIITANWFTLKRGLAVSIALSGSGFGGALLSPFVSSLITTYGWRPAFLALAAICLVLALPLAALTFHTRPSDIGLAPYGAGQARDAGAASAAEEPVRVAVGWSRVKGHPSFWLLVAAFVIMGVINGAVLPNQVTNMTAVTLDGAQIVTGGHDRIWAGNVLSIYLVMVVVGKISLGAIYDRFGLRPGNVLGSVASAVACLGMCFPATDLGPVVGAAMFGIGTCMGTVTPPIQVVKQYGMRDLGQITGMVTSFEMLGFAGGTIASGAVFDAMHTFVPVWAFGVVGSVVMLLLLLASVSSSRTLVERCVAEGAPLLDESGYELRDAVEVAEAEEPLR